MPQTQFAAETDAIFTSWWQRDLLARPLPHLHQSGGVPDEALTRSGQAGAGLVAHE